MFEGSIVDHIVLIPAIYASFSIGEWVVHRYMMHVALYHYAPWIIASEFWYDFFGQMSGRHVTHHSYTNNNDMTIKEFQFFDSKQNKQKKKKKKNTIQLNQEFQGANTMETFQNLYFVWPNTISIFVSILLWTIIMNYYLFQCSFTYLTVICGAFGIYHSAVWNCMHPMLHEFDKRLSWFEGVDIIDRDWFKSTFLYRFLWKNHVLHHVVTGRDSCNFNIALPFADWLFGTFRSSYHKYHFDCDKFQITKV